MKKSFFLIILFSIMILTSCSDGDTEEANANSSAEKTGTDLTSADLDNSEAMEDTKRFVLVKGGVFKNITSEYTEKKIKVKDFYIGKYEVTQKEWTEIMGNNPSGFKGENLPVETVSWYDCIEYCNKRSKKEGLKPYYKINKKKKDPDNDSTVDKLKWVVQINKKANGYRLPTNREWEYAAGGGQKTKDYIYSGGNGIDEVAWYWRISGDEKLLIDWNWDAIEKNNCKSKPIGLKKQNELGLYDMSGNVREWCWDWYEGTDYIAGSARIWKGGGWIGEVIACESAYIGKFEPNGKGNDQGLRLCRGVQ